jgi:hypothetical protein
LIDASQPRLASQVLILDIPLVYFEFAVGFHDGNLQQAGVDLQAPAIRTGIEAKPGQGTPGNRSYTRRGDRKSIRIVAPDLWYIAAQVAG